MGLCEVCSNEPSKYRCPACHMQSCSLACTQAHKIYCTPKAPEEPVQDSDKQNGTAGDSTAGIGVAVASNIQYSENTAASADIPKAAPHPSDLESSQALRDLFVRYPNLRSQLRDIYNLTLEEEWVEMKPNYNHGRGRGRGRGGQHGRGGRSRGPWTEEKGFNRGLGKVKRLRENLENNIDVSDCEGFGQFAALVLADHDTRQTTQSQPER
ncbi:hypothetical protein AJ79_00123 [Helicocarpus griseus UAMH5409]|uniref:HIT-type domain-containing protein n=1 Tax=Helicocarpus griseus UAMH5409 TaxID=1447875 RepID=A0A2B7YDD0_9EURO|nr:hypothetical protein AJ79_00123 [Helicocarpus griseus UAMH5409]